MPKRKNRSLRNIFFWISAGILIILLWSVLQNPNVARKEITFTQFMDQVEQGNVEEVTINDNELRGKARDGGAFKTVLPAGYDDLIKILRENKVMSKPKQKLRTLRLNNQNQLKKSRN